MIKRILIILFIMLIVGGFVSKDALAGPPWPAEIRVREGESCWFSWLDKEGNIIPIYGTGTWVVQWKNGQAQVNCHTIIDFTDPEIATFEEVRGYLESWGWGPEYFRGNGVFRVTTSTQPYPMLCEWDSDHPLADNATWITTPNGNTNFSCHFTFEP